MNSLKSEVCHWETSLRHITREFSVGDQRNWGRLLLSWQYLGCCLFCNLNSSCSSLKDSNLDVSFKLLLSHCLPTIIQADVKNYSPAIFILIFYQIKGYRDCSREHLNNKWKEFQMNTLSFKVRRVCFLRGATMMAKPLHVDLLVSPKGTKLLYKHKENRHIVLVWIIHVQ